MYYVATVQNENTPSLFSYPTLDAALAAFHNELAYRVEGRTSTKCSILDSDLVQIRVESYTAPVQITEATEG